MTSTRVIDAHELVAIDDRRALPEIRACTWGAA